MGVVSILDHRLSKYYGNFLIMLVPFEPMSAKSYTYSTLEFPSFIKQFLHFLFQGVPYVVFFFSWFYKSRVYYGICHDSPRGGIPLE